MPNIRRGFPPGVAPAAIRFAAAANAGVMASSNGSERKMPAPQRNFRRDSAGLVETKGATRGLLKRVFMVSSQWLINSNMGRKSRRMLAEVKLFTAFLGRRAGEMA